MKDKDHRSRQVQDILDHANAVIKESHVVYTSGKHGSAYVDKDKAYPECMNVDFLCRLIAQEFRDEDIELVVGPVQGAQTLAYETAKQHKNLAGRSVLWVYAEKERIAVPDPEGKGRPCFFETGNFVIKRNSDLVRGKRVLVVEDIVNTGGSVRKVVEAVRSMGGEIVGVAAIVNRGGATAEQVGNPPRFVSLLDVHMEAWDEKVCEESQLCFKKVPINTKVGKGKEFLARKAVEPKASW